MMTMRELSAYFDERSKLREINLTLEGLRQYREKGQDSIELSDGIAALEKESRTKAAELEAKAEEVRAALDSVEDVLDRTLAKLHYCGGMTWDEAGAFCGLLGNTAKHRAYRAMRKTIPK